MEADPGDEAETLGRHERSAIVELLARRQPELLTERHQRLCDPVVGAVLDDLDPAPVRGEVDRVERVEAHAAAEVAGPDKIGLVEVAGTLDHDRRSPRHG